MGLDSLVPGSSTITRAELVYTALAGVAWVYAIANSIDALSDWRWQRTHDLKGELDALALYDAISALTRFVSATLFLGVGLVALASPQPAHWQNRAASQTILYGLLVAVALNGAAGFLAQQSRRVTLAQWKRDE